MQSLHSHLGKIHVGARMKKLEEGDSIDWGFAEAMAIGTLLRHGLISSYKIVFE